MSWWASVGSCIHFWWSTNTNNIWNNLALFLKLNIGMTCSKSQWMLNEYLNKYKLTEWVKILSPAFYFCPSQVSWSFLHRRGFQSLAHPVPVCIVPCHLSGYLQCPSGWVILCVVFCFHGISMRTKWANKSKGLRTVWVPHKFYYYCISFSALREK